MLQLSTINSPISHASSLEWQQICPVSWFPVHTPTSVDTPTFRHTPCVHVTSTPTPVLDAAGLLTTSPGNPSLRKTGNPHYAHLRPIMRNTWNPSLTWLLPLYLALASSTLQAVLVLCSCPDACLCIALWRNLLGAFTVRCHFKSALAVRKEEIKRARSALWGGDLGWRDSLIVCAVLQKLFVFSVCSF